MRIFFSCSLLGLGVFERCACRALGRHRSTQRKVQQGRADGEQLTAEIIDLVDQYGRHGHRMITALVNDASWHLNRKRVERIWRQEGLCDR
ncbi:transposase [Loktanella sp. IMCC34160]|nr:transposase [Loktanella sp. IMCC34160]